MILCRIRFLVLAAVVAATVPVASSASAAVTATPDANQVATAMTEGTGTTVTGASWVLRPPVNNPSAVSDTKALGLPNAGSRFAILSTGQADVLLTGPQETSANSNNSGAARGGSDQDAVVLKINLSVPAGANCLGFAFRFASEEYPEYVGKKYNDAFVAELDKNTWTTDASSIVAPDNFAFDPAGAVISVNATGATTVKAEEAAGTVYDGSTPILYAATPVTTGAHSLYLSIFDQGDGILDSAVLLDNLVIGKAGAGGCKGGASTTQQITPTTGTLPKNVFGGGGIVSAPSNKKCISRRKFTIRIRKLKGVKYVAAFVWLNGKRVATRRGSRVTARINLRGLPKGRYKVKIRVVTTKGQVVTGTRQYRTCAKKSSKRSKPKL